MKNIGARGTERGPDLLTKPARVGLAAWILLVY